MAQYETIVIGTLDVGLEYHELRLVISNKIEGLAQEVQGGIMGRISAKEIKERLSRIDVLVKKLGEYENGSSSEDASRPGPP